MAKFSLSKIFCIVFVVFAATAIASPAQTFTTLVNFDGTNGANPDSTLIQGSDGNFYGTTVSGGFYDMGTIFKMTPGGTLTTVLSFDGADGAYPDGAVEAMERGLTHLILDISGYFAP